MYGLLDEIEYVFNTMTNILDSINCKKYILQKIMDLNLVLGAELFLKLQCYHLALKKFL